MKSTLVIPIQIRIRAQHTLMRGRGGNLAGYQAQYGTYGPTLYAEDRAFLSVLQAQVEPVRMAG